MYIKIGKKEPTLNFQNLNEDKVEINNNVLYFKKVVKPSNNEIKNHSEYLKSSLKKNFFN